MPALIVVVVAVAVADVVAWGAFRLDKARAKRGVRRIRERTLLCLAVPGGLGALLAMYGHRQRHKVAKWHFVVLVGATALAQAALVGWIAFRAAQ